MRKYDAMVAIESQVKEIEPTDAKVVLAIEYDGEVLASRNWQFKGTRQRLTALVDNKAGEKPTSLDYSTMIRSIINSVVKQFEVKNIEFVSVVTDGNTVTITGRKQK